MTLCYSCHQLINPRAVADIFTYLLSSQKDNDTWLESTWLGFLLVGKHEPH